jgi:hypothetical protein
MTLVGANANLYAQSIPMVFPFASMSSGGQAYQHFVANSVGYKPIEVFDRI